MNKKIIDFLQKNQLTYKTEADFAIYNTLHLKSEISLVVEVNKQDIFLQLVQLLQSEQIPCFVIGGGSNIAPGSLIDAVAIIIRFGKIKRIDDNMIAVEAGCPIGNLLNYSHRHELGGVEFLAGIPGTVGGACAVNAGAMQKSIADYLVNVQLLNEDGKLKTYDAAALNFSYRCSELKFSGKILLSVLFKLEKKPAERIKEMIKENIGYRRKNHPSYRLYSAGCFFKNPEVQGRRVSAGLLIAESGCRGFRTKNFYLAEKHSNFIINKGEGTLEELQEFENRIKERVFSEKGVRLEREVVYLDKSGKKF